MGTPAYMSPEQAEGKPVDARSDIFSFGAVLYEMATGTSAFRGESAASTLAAVLTASPNPPSQTAPHLPRELERLIVRSLRKEPSRRYQSMADLTLELEEIKTESLERIEPAMTAPAARPRWPWVAVAAAARRADCRRRGVVAMVDGDGCGPVCHRPADHQPGRGKNAVALTRRHTGGLRLGRRSAGQQ